MNRAPRAFISYSWSSPEHQQWVITLATQLRENGVDVVLDKWDLKEGHDAVAFMERMVTDPKVTKVIVILDRSYAEKADRRKGGVGTETQIISREVYSKADQSKFVGVASELDADGKAFAPTYYGSRIYIDLSDSDIFASNFEQLLRWIFDKPLHVKPSLGKPPEFVGEHTISSGTAARARLTKDAIRNNTATAPAILDEYLQELVKSLEKFRIDRTNNQGEADDTIVENIDIFIPVRNEFIELTKQVSRFYQPIFADIYHTFFEKTLFYFFKPPHITYWSDWDADNFKFVVHELFLYVLAIFIQDGRFDAASKLINTPYYVGEIAENRNDPMVDYTSFREHARSFEHRNQRLGLRRISLRADILEKRSHTSGISFRSIMQADFVLYLHGAIRSFKSQSFDWGWWPETLLYTGRNGRPFEIFARSQSKTFFKKLHGILGVTGKEELVAALTAVVSGNNMPRWDFTRLDIYGLSNLDELETKP